jgi:hypothetical protein
MYTKEVKLRDDEVAAKINTRTGEIFEVKSRPNNIPDNKEVFFPEGYFHKSYDHAWNYLLEVLKPVELKIVVQMCQIASVRSNSLQPLNNETTILSLSKKFDIPRNNVNKIFNKLYGHGVYAEFNFAQAPLSFDINDTSTFNDKYISQKYWVLNPYIAFKGKIIDIGIADLFKETKITKYVLDKQNKK